MSTSNSNDDDTKVVLEQTLFKTDEAFVYRIPPMMTSGGHHASDWDLANPVATCSVHVLRRDSDLLIKLLADKPKLNAPPGATEKYLFAQSKITLDFTSSSASSSAVTADANTNAAKAKLKIEHWVETVTDSSRYFVIRISDEKRNKEAHVGMGFRERNDSMNFKMSLQDYENTMKKEAMVISSSNSSSRNDNDDKATSTDGSSGVGEEPSSGIQPSKSEDFSDMNNSSTSNTPIEAAVSKLSLKEGEKIHINLKATSSPSPSKNRTKRSSITGSGSKPPMLLRKPPPPASSTGTGAPVPLPPTSSSMPSSSSLPSKKVNVVINTDALKIQNDLHINNSNGGGSHSHQTDNSCVSSVAAVAETFEHDSDDEWGDFESPSFNED